MHTISAAIFTLFLTLPLPQTDSAGTSEAPVRVAQTEQAARTVSAQRIPAFWIILPD